MRKGGCEPERLVNTIEKLARAPIAAFEFVNILLTQNDAKVGATPKDVVWTHRQATLYRYRSDKRRHPIPVPVVFALITGPTSSICALEDRSSSTCLTRLGRVPHRPGLSRGGGR